MIYTFNDAADGYLSLSIGEEVVHTSDQVLSILWNKGAERVILIDGTPMSLPSGSFLTLMTTQVAKMMDWADTVTWRYNREFYCILDHDEEVSCAGFLFYGSHGRMLIQPSVVDATKFQALLEVFRDEFQTTDTIQGEMLRMLLKRLIIKLTRLGKAQYLQDDTDDIAYDLLRQYNLLVEKSFKQMHQVQDYAALLHRSPKTLSNVFSQLGSKTPLQIIQDRIALEAKRQLMYTDLTSSEIGYDLGFGEPAHFSRFFKKVVGKSPSQFKKELTSA
ncbi:MAG: helix-turn-helix domain-containing protein [Bacteroidota bacterium]